MMMMMEMEKIVKFQFYHHNNLENKEDEEGEEK